MYIRLVPPFQFTQPIKPLQSPLKASRSVYNSDGIGTTDGSKDIKLPVLTSEDNKKLYDLLFAKFKYTNQHIGIEDDGQTYLITLQRYLMHINDDANLNVLQTIVNDSELGIRLRTSEEVAEASQTIAEYIAKFRERRK
jgi:hypothetical protein